MRLRAASRRRFIVNPDDPVYPCPLALGASVVADDCPICRVLPSTRRATLHDFGVNDDENMYVGANLNRAVPFRTEARRILPPSKLVSLAEKIAAWRKEHTA